MVIFIVDSAPSSYHMRTTWQTQWKNAIIDDLLYWMKKTMSHVSFLLNQIIYEVKEE